MGADSVHTVDMGPASYLGRKVKGKQTNSLVFGTRAGKTKRSGVSCEIGKAAHNRYSHSMPRTNKASSAGSDVSPC